MAAPLPLDAEDRQVAGVEERELADDCVHLRFVLGGRASPLVSRRLIVVLARLPLETSFLLRERSLVAFGLLRVPERFSRPVDRELPTHIRASLHHRMASALA